MTLAEIGYQFVLITNTSTKLSIILKFYYISSQNKDSQIIEILTQTYKLWRLRMKMRD
jgi:hypothetical protein